jgi:hypothetical protein
MYTREFRQNFAIQLGREHPEHGEHGLKRAQLVYNQSSAIENILPETGKVSKNIRTILVQGKA